MIVMKFGSASLATCGGLLQVADLVASTTPAPCVVLSAIGDTRQRLGACADLAASGALDRATATLDATALAIRALANELPHALDGFDDACGALTRDAGLLLRGVARRGATPQALDALLPHAERYATALLTALLRARGADAAAVDARDVIRTNAAFGGARPDRGQLRQLAHQSVGPLVGRGVIVVTQGGVGRGPDGATTSLGEHGDVLSAALLGAALGAERVQVWTDGAAALPTAAVQPATDRGIDVTAHLPLGDERQRT